MIHGGYVDIDYRADGSLVPERHKAAPDPEAIADIALRMLERGGREATEGSWLAFPVQSICLHGDGPNAVALTSHAHATGRPYALVVGPADG
jgi:UPF0271 protein